MTVSLLPAAHHHTHQQASRASQHAGCQRGGHSVAIAILALKAAHAIRKPPERVACSSRLPYWMAAQLSMIPERCRPRPSANKERRTTQNKVRLLFQFSVCHGLQELRGPHLRVPFTRCTRCLPCHIPGTVELWLVELSPLFAGCSICARPSHIRRWQLIIEPYLQSRSLFGIN